MPRRPVLRLVLLAVAVLGATAPAQAAPTTIPGDPLRVHADVDGRLQARFVNTAAGEFEPPDADAADAGLNVTTTEGTDPAETRYGFLDTPFTPGNQAPSLTGSGTAEQPFQIRTTYDAGALQITQDVIYVNGARSFTVRYDFKATNRPVTFRAALPADLFLAEGATQQGLLRAGPPRFVGGTDPGAARTGGIEEVAESPWEAFEANAVAKVFADARTRFDNSISPGPVDIAAGVEFPKTALAQGQEESFSAVFAFPRTLVADLDPKESAQSTGRTQTLTATVAGAGEGESVRYEVTGANPTAGEVRTDASGKAAITWLGQTAGRDTVSAYVDADRDDARDPDEPLRSATVDWTAPGQDPEATPTPTPTPAPTPTPVPGLPTVPPTTGDPSAPLSAADIPVPGRTVVAEPVSGRNEVRVAGTDEFVELRGRAVLPVGSALDTTTGRVRIISAADDRGTLQRGVFFSGPFVVDQAAARRPYLEIRLADASLRRFGGTCRRSRTRSAETSARRRTTRRVWGDAKGRYRTRGRYSSATVRGTRWLVEDSCGRTTTRVTRGVVRVRDRVRDRTVTLRAGDRYVARKPQRRRR